MANVLTAEKLISLLGVVIRPYANTLCTILQTYTVLPDIAVDELGDSIQLRLSWDVSAERDRCLQIDSMELVELRTRSVSFAQACTEVLVDFREDVIVYTIRNPGAISNSTLGMNGFMNFNRIPDSVCIYLGGNLNDNIMSLGRTADRNTDPLPDPSVVRRVVQIYLHSMVHTPDFSLFYEDTDRYSRLVLRGVEKGTASMLMAFMRDPLVAASRATITRKELHVDFIKGSIVSSRKQMAVPPQNLPGCDTDQSAPMTAVKAKSLEKYAEPGGSASTHKSAILPETGPLPFLVRPFQMLKRGLRRWKPY